MNLRCEIALLIFAFLVIMQLNLDMLNQNWSAQDWADFYLKIFEQAKKNVQPEQPLGFVTDPETQKNHKAFLGISRYAFAPAVVKDSPDENIILGCFNREKTLLEFSQKGNYGIEKFHKSFAVLRKNK